jgi:hypothetical protein
MRRWCGRQPGSNRHKRAPPASEQISAGRPQPRGLAPDARAAEARGGPNRPRFPCSDLRCRRAQTGTDIGTSAAQARGGRRRQASPPASRLGAAGNGTASEPFASESSGGLATGPSACASARASPLSGTTPAPPGGQARRQRVPELASPCRAHGTAIQNYGARKARGPPLRKGASAWGDARPLRSNTVRIAAARARPNNPRHADRRLDSGISVTSRCASAAARRFPCSRHAPPPAMSPAINRRDAHAGRPIRHKSHTHAALTPAHATIGQCPYAQITLDPAPPLRFTATP